ncbi:hypothetical protein K438DRAFT_1657214 [Mycena galopus ATCC 62051]|nr:hypothetical protein K438DRAFT_1657214 [Mycena galopus ATCC 62051]
MAPAMSPPPSWEAMREPTPSDEDLVPNDSASFSTQRKRKNKSKSTAQPQSKRPKTTESELGYHRSKRKACRIYLCDATFTTRL